VPVPAPFSRPLTDPGQRSEALAGLVERVTFHNADSGFCVLRVKARGQRVSTADS
jgi:exodeoxyribonuclease V alpha subunit